MSLEEYIPNESTWESGWASNEKAHEISEKFKEHVKKASAWIKRTKKDESKAKKQDLLLANFLVKIIISKKFDSILELLFKLIDKGYPSNFLLWILSLIYIEISDKIRESNNLEKINFSYSPEKTIDFDDSDINPQVKNRINYWVEDIILSVAADYSHILTSRLIKLLNNKEDDISYFISTVFIFFLKEINISINKNESINIWNFILLEVLKKINSLNIEKI
jgi:hypothetical protein